MKKAINICLAVLILFASCKEERNEPLTKDGPAPAPVLNATVQPLSGGAKITYVLPNDPNVLYVKAVYESPKGTVKEVKSSSYGNSLVITGLGSTNTYDVNLYAVSRNEKQSDPLAVKIVPLTPPILTVRASITADADFGGLYVTYTNPDTANIVITILTKLKATDDWTEAEVNYTKSPQGNMSARGFDAVPRIFGVFVKDRWNNRSDTLIKTVTPIYESQLDKSKFKKYVLSSDVTNKTNYFYNAAGQNMALEKAWNGKAGPTDVEAFQTNAGTGMPGWFTIDLGVTTKLSRWLYQARMDLTAVIWKHAAFKDYEVYVWTGAGLPSDDFSLWTKAMSCLSVKPSGLPVGTETAEDIAAGLKGEEWRFDRNLPPVRYVRIKCNSTWGSTNYMSCVELTFWGQ
ncbi:DUF4959 domain-containing protein [Mucilaginibacter sp. AW1-3]